ncbi:MAG: MerR family transcriptional regulator [Ruminococcaceae bacterium]|nr:MerR family transcriptional regulator [Oscillospiraceae bacterium]
MTIKELEDRSGMNRSNIRFYEREGLISPQRHDNNYRDYSEEDLQQLLRIRLLRSLELPLEEIRALQRGEKELDLALQEHLRTLEQQEQALQCSQQVCRDIRRDGARYETLDARHYLDAMQTPAGAPASVPEKDTVPRVRSPWRRFFARRFDLMLYGSVWIILGLLLLQKSPATEQGGAWFDLTFFISVLMMLLFEPLFLCTWGTTPGKWLLGLRVTNNTGQKLDYSEGIYRTFQALWSGAGFFIPIVEIFRGYQRYYDCIEGKTMAWEWDSELVLQDEKNWRIAAVVGGIIAQFALILLCGLFISRPVHQGDLTIAQFAENYNRQAKIREFECWLDENGRWTDYPRPDGGVVIHMHDIDPPDFVYTEEDGLMTGLSFSLSVEGDQDSMLPLFTNRRLLAVYAYVQAFDPTPLSTKEIDAVVQSMADDPFTPASHTIHGVRISWQLEHSGYYEIDSMDCLWPQEEETPQCAMIFTIEKVS